MTLKMGSPALNNNEPSISPQQQRNVELEQNTAKLEGVYSRLDQAISKSDVFDAYPKEIQDIFKESLAKEIYLKYGQNAEVGKIETYTHGQTGENLIYTKANKFFNVEINPNKLIEDYAQKNPHIDLEGLKQNIAEQTEKIALEKQFNLEKGELLGAIAEAKNERNSAVLEREREIESTGRIAKLFGKTPERIPNLTEQWLSKEEILKHVDPKIAESESFQNSLNAMLKNMDASLTKEVDGVFWDTMKDHLISKIQSAISAVDAGVTFVGDTAKTTVAVAESVATGTINTFQEGFNGTSALIVGAYVGVKEWDLDKGVEVANHIINNTQDYGYQLELTDFSKEQLASSETMQYVATSMHNQTEAFYGAVGDLWGERAEEYTRGVYGTSGKIMTVYIGAGAVTGAKNFAMGVGRKAPTDIYLKTSSIDLIEKSGRIWGQTEGSVYGMAVPNASRARTFIDTKNINPGTIHLTGEAAALFKPHEVTGFLSGIKRVTGQYKAPFGDIAITEGATTFDVASNTLTISHAKIVPHMERVIFKTKYTPDGILKLSGEQYANFAASKLWGRRLIIEPAMATPAGLMLYFKHDKGK